jgi:hypothetical protein
MTAGGKARQEEQQASERWGWEWKVSKIQNGERQGME